MRIALEDLGLASLTVIYPGPDSFPLSKKITAMGFERFVRQTA
jgi:hypothetical protein